MVRSKKSTPPLTPGKKIQPTPGLLDVVTDMDPLWDVLYKRFDKYAKTFGFSKVDVPIIDDALVFRTADPRLGDALVTFEAAGREMAVRPHMLPQVLRSYYAAKPGEARPMSKWAYMGQVVTSAGKNQLQTNVEFGFEVFGVFTHLTEAQGIGAAWELVSSLGIRNLMLEINTAGSEECQDQYQGALADFLKSKKYDLCDSCVEQLPSQALQILRCEELDCQAILVESPVILDFLDTDSRRHFTNILEALEELQIPYQLNPLYVGKQGSGETSFVIKYKSKTATVVIGEGAYHTALFQKLNGKSQASFGFTGSFSRLYEILQREQVEVQREQKNEVYLVPLGELAAKKSLRLFRDLISARISVYDHFGNVGVKSQLKAAQDSKSPIALIMGQKEAMDEMVILRDVKSGMQEMFHYDRIIDEVKKRLGK